MPLSTFRCLGAFFCISAFNDAVAMFVRLLTLPAGTQAVVAESNDTINSVVSGLFFVPILDVTDAIDDGAGDNTINLATSCSFATFG